MHPYQYNAVITDSIGFLVGVLSRQHVWSLTQVFLLAILQENHWHPAWIKKSITSLSRVHYSRHSFQPSSTPLKQTLIACSIFKETTLFLQ